MLRLVALAAESLWWHSRYAFGGSVDQAAMEQTFRKLTNRSVVAVRGAVA